jgi:hypothetical protein
MRPAQFAVHQETHKLPITTNDAPLLTLGRADDQERGVTLPLISQSFEFERLNRQQKVRFLREAQGALRTLEFELAEDVDRAAAREKARQDLIAGKLPRGWPTELSVQAALPSYKPYYNAYGAVEYLLWCVEELWQEDVDPEIFKALAYLETVMKYLLQLARSEASAIGVDLDHTMRGWFAVSRVPHGSPTAGIPV